MRDRNRAPSGGRVLVLDPGGSRGALAGCRLLAAAGWTVGVMAPRPTLASRSRWTAALHPTPRPAAGAEYVEAAARVVGRHGYDLVVPADDESAFVVSLGRDEIPAAMPYATHDVVARALDKAALYEVATAAGVAVPESLPGDAIAPGDLPVVVKPRTHASPGPRRGRHEAVVARTIDAAKAAVDALVVAGVEPLVQEVVAGRLDAMSIVSDRAARTVARVQQTALRTWPPRAGVSAAAETVPIDDTLTAGVDSIAADLGWFGLAEVQFLTPSDGRPRLIDWNGRLYGSLALAAAAGVNLADVWARLSVGLPVEVAPARVGCRYQWLEGDLRAVVADRRWSGVVPTLAYGLRAAHSVSSIRDPRPAASHAGDLAMRLLRKGLRA